MKSVRRALEAHVIGCNKPLAPVVRKMNIIILLRNAHPHERVNFAYSLLNSGSITQEQLKEFNKPISREVL